MNMRQLIDKYVAYRQSLGEQFDTNGRVLRTYGRFVGESTKPESVTSEQAKRFVDGNGPITNSRRKRYDALKGLYEFAISRGFTASSPLPVEAPARGPSLVPYLYHREELRSLLQATEALRYKTFAEPITTRTILLLLYGTGVRIREAIRLNDDDVDLEECIITIRKTKFYKSRLVPFGSQLRVVLQRYSKERTAAITTGQRPFFTSRIGLRLNQNTFTAHFRRVCNQANIRRDDAAVQPRLHDLRHTFAVHRLTSWYRQGADVQRLLPKLAVYLGHVNISATQTYLSMTPELLEAAGRRFDQYANKERRHG
jgi:site-specific recombinase XerD